MCEKFLRKYKSCGHWCTIYAPCAAVWRGPADVERIDDVPDCRQIVARKVPGSQKNYWEEKAGCHDRPTECHNAIRRAFDQWDGTLADRGGAEPGMHPTSRTAGRHAEAEYFGHKDSCRYNLIDIDATRDGFLRARQLDPTKWKNGRGDRLW